MLQEDLQRAPAVLKNDFHTPGHTVPREGPTSLVDDLDAVYVFIGNHPDSLPKGTMSKVTVYTLPDCVQCDRTKKLMDRDGIAYDPVKLEEHPDIAEKFRAQGILQAPVVVIGHDGRHWSGFRPELIKELKPSDKEA